MHTCDPSRIALEEMILREADPYGQIIAVFLVCIFFNYSASSSILVIKTFINKD
jgi:hypothetical protein